MRTQKRMCGITKTRIGEICKETNRGHYTNIRVVIHGCRYWKDLSSRLHAMVLSQLVVNKRSLAYSHLQARSARGMNGEEELLFRLYTFQRFTELPTPEELALAYTGRGTLRRKHGSHHRDRARDLPDFGVCS